MKTALALLTLLALGAPEPTELGFDVLAGFDYEEGMELPKEVTDYDGKKVTIGGFMQREDAGDGPTEYFMLVSAACGCEGTPLLNEVVFCAMPDGEAVDMEVGSVAVTGTLYVSEETDEGIVVSLYTMDVETFEP